MIFIAALNYLPALFASHCKGNSFFLLPTWYKYLTLQHDAGGNCEVAGFEFPMDLLPVGIAITEMLLRIAGFVAVIAVIIAGIKYMTAQGNPEKAASARKSLYFAIIGVLIAMVAASLVSFIGNRLNP